MQYFLLFFLPYLVTDAKENPDGNSKVLAELAGAAQYKDA